MVAKRGVTVKGFAPTYLAWCRVHNAPKTVTSKEMYVRRFVRFFNTTPLADIKRANVERYIQTRSAVAGNPTVNRETAALKHIFTYAIALEHVEHNPVKGIKLLPEHRKSLVLPSADEIKEWLKWCRENDPLLYELSAIALNTGLRRGDVVRITAQNIDLENHVLRVPMSKTGREICVPLNTSALRVLTRRKKEWVKSYAKADGILKKIDADPTDPDLAVKKIDSKAQDILTVLLRGDEIRCRDLCKWVSVYRDSESLFWTFAGIFTGYIFLSLGLGTAPHLQEFKRRYETARRKTHFKYPFKYFRHVFATTALRTGANVRVVQALLGHTTLRMTERYLAFSEPEKQEAVKALPWAV